MVGCDGARSAVRGSVGIPFEGATYPESFVFADVRMDWRLPNDEVQLFFSPEGLVVVAPLPGERRHRIVATVVAAVSPSLCGEAADPEALVGGLRWGLLACVGFVVAATAAFLASEKAAAITGTFVNASSGMFSS